ncbi:MAG: hypothetical protein ABEJ70_03310 [Halobacteriaceae archaeon]
MFEPTTPRTDDSLDAGTVTYEHVRVVVVPEGPRHYSVEVADGGDRSGSHAVERVLVNSAEVVFEETLWFADVQVDVGVPIGVPGDTAWIWT